MITIEFIIMSDRYYVSCHVKFYMQAIFLEKSYYYISYYKLPPLSQDPQGVVISLLYYCHKSYCVIIITG